MYTIRNLTSGSEFFLHGSIDDIVIRPNTEMDISDVDYMLNQTSIEALVADGKASSVYTVDYNASEAMSYADLAAAEASEATLYSSEAVVDAAVAESKADLAISELALTESELALAQSELEVVGDLASEADSRATLALSYGRLP